LPRSSAPSTVAFVSSLRPMPSAVRSTRRMTHCRSSTALASASKSRRED
jgi:hypothetical protein